MLRRPVVGGLVMLAFRHSGRLWSVRFHSVHSMLIAAAGGLVIGALHLIEWLSPWILSVLAKEIRLGMELVFAMTWLVLVWSAYDGTRCAVLPPIHMLAIRLVRRYERWTALAPARTA